MIFIHFIIGFINILYVMLSVVWNIFWPTGYILEIFMFLIIPTLCAVLNYYLGICKILHKKTSNFLNVTTFILSAFLTPYVLVGNYLGIIIWLTKFSII